jgi:hypothetical protein
MLKGIVGGKRHVTHCGRYELASQSVKSLQHLGGAAILWV